MPRILVVEDEDAIAVGLVDVLKVKGYEVERADNGEDALALALQTNYDLILLDVELPGLGGFEVLKELRQGQNTTRVIMLTARKTEMDRVLGFELGVDDYVTKPFSLLELLGRINAILRRGSGYGTEEEPASTKLLTLGPCEIDFERFLVTRDGSEINLPAKAFDILKTLVNRNGQVISRDTLMDEVWGVEESITLRTLNNLVVKIRQAIEEHPDRPTFLKTVHGVGYRIDLP